MLTAAKPAAEYVKGYLLTRPATRTAYNNIIKNAAKGSFEALKGDFDIINNEITKEFGDVNEFVSQMIDDIENTIKTLRMLGDTAGGNAQKLDTITRGFTKSMLKGKVDLESLNMIAESGVPIFSEL